jgi:hypothetical protein
VSWPHAWRPGTITRRGPGGPIGPVDVRLVLTGPGGGTWDVAVGGGPPAPAAVMIVTDTVGFCRLAANRITPADLDLHITGDPACAAGVLAAASTLALDQRLRSGCPGDPSPDPATYPGTKSQSRRPSPGGSCLDRNKPCPEPGR